jgi:hypothetical protein
MGIPRGVARMLLDEARERPFRGSVVDLGRSIVHFRHDELARWAREQGVVLRDVGPLELSHAPRLAASGCLSNRDLFRLLGFDSVSSLDVSAWEGADLLHDLNRPIPPELAGRFDLVFESGTLQHIFDVPAALRNAGEMAKVGGRVVHGMAPSSNHVDHGFWMFSPTAFHDYYAANRWRIETELFFDFAPFWVGGRFDSAPWRIYRYEPGCLDPVAYGGLGRRQLGIFVVATKTAESTVGVIPQQGYFQRYWAAASARAGETPRVGIEDRMLARPPLRPLVYAVKRLRAALRRHAPKPLPPVHRRY